MDSIPKDTQHLIRENIVSVLMRLDSEAQATDDFEEKCCKAYAIGQLMDKVREDFGEDEAGDIITICAHRTIRDTFSRLK